MKKQKNGEICIMTSFIVYRPPCQILFTRSNQVGCFGKVHSTCGSKEKYIQNFGRIPAKKEPHLRSMHRWKDTITIICKQMQ
jgi:hypothetical protein